MQKPQAGDTIGGKYRLVRLLGEGGFGVVWLATQLEINRRVALKLLKSPGGDAARRFEIEARALARLDHPNCVTLYDFGRTPDGNPYLVTEFLDGTQLSDWSRSATNEQRLTAARDIASALAAAHDQGVLHRDLKPDNVIVIATPDGPSARVLDFGIAKLGGAEPVDITKTGEVFGTPGYMSPEQLRAVRDLTPAVDLYALGAVLFEMFEGRPVFDGRSAIEIAMQHLKSAPPPATDSMPAHIRELVAALLSKDPAARPASARAVLEVLEEDERPTSPLRAMRPTRPTPLAVEPARPAVPKLVRIALLAVFVLVGAIVWKATQDDPLPAPTSAPPTRDISSLTGPARQPEVQPPTVSATPTNDADGPDADRADAGEVDLGCRRPDLGEQVVPLRGDRLVAYLPDHYSPTRPQPVIVVLHDTAQEPNDIVRSPPIQAIANALGAVVLLPKDDMRGGTWEAKEDHERVLRDIEHARTELCLDVDRLFAIGMGSGGDEAHRIGCDLPAVAIATTGFRLFDRDRSCRGRRQPTLVVSPLEDAYVPEEGGKGCVKQSLSKYVSVDEHERRVSEARTCQGIDEPRPVVGGSCAEGRSCESRLRVCRVNGGRFWPDLAPSIDVCPTKASDFNYAEQITEFFQSALAAD